MENSCRKHKHVFNTLLLIRAVSGGVGSSAGGGGASHGALPAAGDVLPPQRGEVTLLAGRREGLAPGAPSWSLSLQLGHLEPDRRDTDFNPHQVHFTFKLPVSEAKLLRGTAAQEELLTSLSQLCSLRFFHCSLLEK